MAQHVKNVRTYIIITASISITGSCLRAATPQGGRCTAIGRVALHLQGEGRETRNWAIWGKEQNQAFWCRMTEPLLLIIIMMKSSSTSLL